jgi:hypothetical protein
MPRTPATLIIRLEVMDGASGSAWLAG